MTPSSSDRHTRQPLRSDVRTQETSTVPTRAEAVVTRKPNRVKAHAPRGESVWLTSAEAAFVLGVTLQTLYRWRWKGIGPRAEGGRGLVRYLRADLDAWIRSRSSSPAA